MQELPGAGVHSRLAVRGRQRSARARASTAWAIPTRMAVFEQCELVRGAAGGMGEHGPHAIALGPDGPLYYNNGNHAHLKPPIDPASPVNVAYEGELLPHYNDSRGHAAGIMAPGGEILRSDDDGKTWKRVVAGFRNEYDFAFNADGELFTFDSDMEWDVGLPWYRPVRVNHCPIGAEFGWRNGSGKWPTYYLRQPAGRPRRRPGEPDRRDVLPGQPVPGEVSRQLPDLRLVARTDPGRLPETGRGLVFADEHRAGQRPAAQLHRHRGRPRWIGLFHDRRSRHPGRAVPGELERKPPGRATGTGAPIDCQPGGRTSGETRTKVRAACSSIRRWQASASTDR